MAYAKINTITNANMAKVDSIVKANIGKISSIGFFIDNISFDFDGANDYLSGGSAAASNATLETTGSISMWVKLDAMSANGVMWQITAETGTDNQLFILWQNEFGKVVLN